MGQFEKFRLAAAVLLLMAMPHAGVIAADEEPPVEFDYQMPEETPEVAPQENVQERSHKPKRHIIKDPGKKGAFRKKHRPSQKRPLGKKAKPASRRKK